MSPHSTPDDWTQNKGASKPRWNFMEGKPCDCIGGLVHFRQNGSNPRRSTRTMASNSLNCVTERPRELFSGPVWDEFQERPSHGSLQSNTLASSTCACITLWDLLYSGTTFSCAKRIDRLLVVVLRNGRYNLPVLCWYYSGLL